MNHGDSCRKNQLKRGTIMKVYIDPGHGGNNPGATYNGRKESEDVFRLSQSVKESLEKFGVTVKLSRTSDEDPELNARTKQANDWKADYFISIHRNAFSPNKAQGIEVYCYSEIKEGGETYNMAKNILEKTASAAEFINRGVKLGAPAYKDYAVNRDTKMSSCLLEVGFIDSDSDNEKFDLHLDDMANAIALAICENGGISTFIKGDVDGDGKITAEDARLTLRASVGSEKLSEEQTKRADVDGDGKLTASDARTILRKATGLEE